MSKKAPAAADVIVVPGHKNPRCSQDRIDKAIQLFQAGEAKALLLCGGGSEARGMAKSARCAGIPDSALTLEEDSSTTMENALFSAKIIDQNQWQTAIIVSHSYHLARLWLCFRKTSLKHIALVSTPFPSGPGQQGEWILALMRESIALPYYLLKIWSA